MREGYYGKEPFDLRLTALRMLRNLNQIIVFTLAGTLVFGGGYYVRNVLLYGETLYSAESTYKVEYSDPDWAGDGTYINEATWETYVHTEEFLNMVQKRLKEQENGWELDNPELSGMLEARLATDLRVPSTIVTSTLPEKTLDVAKAVEKAMTEDFPAAMGEVDSIRVINPAGEAAEVVPDVRPGRAFALSALLSCFFTVVILLLKETGDDSIWLPSTIRKRYGLPVLGTLNSRDFLENAAYLLREKERVGVCFAGEEGNPEELAKRLGEHTDISFVPVQAPICFPEAAKKIRELDGVVVGVKAGRHAGKPLEYTLEYLSQQDCEIIAALLWEADEGLIRAYYCFEGAGTGYFGKKRKQETGNGK